MSPHRRRIVRLGLDLAALLLLLAYALLALAAEGQGGAAALDPIWVEAQARGSLRVAVDVGFAPFVMREGEALVGYDIDLVRMLSTRLGLAPPTFVPTGFDALYDALNSGRVDLIASALPYAPEQGYRARFSSIYFDAGQVLVVAAAGPINGPADLAGLRIGVALGSEADSLARRMAEGGAGFTLRNDFDEPGAALAALRAGQLDAVITDHVTALSTLAGEPALRIAAALSSEPLVLAMPRAAFRLEAELNQALAEMRRAGELDALNQRWMYVKKLPVEAPLSCASSARAQG